MSSDSLSPPPDLRTGPRIFRIADSDLDTILRLLVAPGHVWPCLPPATPTTDLTGSIPHLRLQTPGGSSQQLLPAAMDSSSAVRTGKASSQPAVPAASGSSAAVNTGDTSSQSPPSAATAPSPTTDSFSYLASYTPNPSSASPLNLSILLAHRNFTIPGTHIFYAENVFHVPHNLVLDFPPRQTLPMALQDLISLPSDRARQRHPPDISYRRLVLLPEVSGGDGFSNLRSPATDRMRTVQIDLSLSRDIGRRVLEAAEKSWNAAIATFRGIREVGEVEQGRIWAAKVAEVVMELWIYRWDTCRKWKGVSRLIIKGREWTLHLLEDPEMTDQLERCCGETGTGETSCGMGGWECCVQRLISQSVHDVKSYLASQAYDIGRKNALGEILERGEPEDPDWPAWDGYSTSFPSPNPSEQEPLASRDPLPTPSTIPKHPHEAIPFTNLTPNQRHAYRDWDPNPPSPSSEDQVHIPGIGTLTLSTYNAYRDANWAEDKKKIVGRRWGLWNQMEEEEKRVRGTRANRRGKRRAGRAGGLVGGFPGSEDGGDVGGNGWNGGRPRTPTYSDLTDRDAEGTTDEEMMDPRPRDDEETVVDYATRPRTERELGLKWERDL